MLDATRVLQITHPVLKVLAMEVFSHFGSEEEKEEGGSCVGISNSQANMDTYPFSKLNLLLTQIIFLIIN